MAENAKTWHLREVLAFSEEYLAKAKIKNSKREAQWLVSELLGLSRLQMYLQLDRPLIKEELAKIRNGLSRKAKLEPLAYICGVQPFRGLRLEVGPDVLIPRPRPRNWSISSGV
jgi:release factor glutamine methyltransferase